MSKKIDEYVEEVKNCITKEEIEKFLADYELTRDANATLKGKKINEREFLTYILNNINKSCAQSIKNKKAKEWNNPGNLAKVFFENVFGDEFQKIEDENKEKEINNSSYQIPEINYSTSTNSMFISEAINDIWEFKESLNKDDFFNKNLWKEALKQKHFMPVFAEFLYDQDDFDKLVEFLKDNFKEEIYNKFKEEIDRDLKNLSSDEVEINKTSLIYTRNFIFDYFFDENNEEIFKILGLNKFYEDGIFDKLVKKDLDELNLFLLASLVNWNFNGEFFSSDCKRVIGALLDLDYYYDEDKSIEIFADKILYKMMQDLSDFYYILDEDTVCLEITLYINNSIKLKEFFEDEDNKSEAIQVFYDWRSKLPWPIIDSCEELERIWDEDELNSIVENEEYESFEEMCEDKFGE
jgi:hypothetical protein